MIHVMFRVDESGVFAILPCTPSTLDPALCDCFTHAGHCAADPAKCIAHSRPARFSEYKELKHRMEAFYNYRGLKVCKRTPRDAMKKRLDEIRSYQHA